VHARRRARTWRGHARAGRHHDAHDRRGVDTDRLDPLRLQAELAQAIPACPGLDVISSPYGHDAFLLASDAVAELVRRTLLANGSVPRPVTACR
jgi:hypothetical protein